MCCKCSSKTNKQIHSNPQPIFTKRNKLQTKFYLHARHIHEKEPLCREYFLHRLNGISFISKRVWIKHGRRNFRRELHIVYLQ